MTTNVLAPLIGEGVEELSVVAWKKKPGEFVREGECLVELESDKVVTEVPSPATGSIAELLAAEGDTVRAGAIIAVIDAAAVGAQAAESSAPTAPTALALGHTARSDFLSPVVRKLVAEHAVDPALITGSGVGGRVTKEDVLAFIAARAAAEGAASVVAPPGAVPPTVAARPPYHRPHTILRKRIAERMIASQLTSAHVLTVAEADMSAIVAHRAANKEAFAKRGVKLTLSAYFISVLARALRRFPDMNASWTDEHMILHPDVNIGLAVSLGDGGLIVPVLKRADELDLFETARGVDAIAEAARGGRLGNEDVKGGTFTLTNYGTTGSLIAAPIINQPQIGILGTGTLQKRPVVLTNPEGVDAIAIRTMVYISLVFDHRALDGEAASIFLRSVKEGLENWAERYLS